MRIFAGVPWRGVKRQWGQFSVLSDVRLHTLLYETKIIIRYYLVPCRLSTDPKIHDLEWPFYVQFSRLRERIADLSQTKSCGRYIVETLTNKANISI